MDINKINNNDKTTLFLSGRLDSATAPKLHDELLPEFDKTLNIELDFSALAYVSSAGLRVLLMGQKTAKAKGGKLTLTNVSEEIIEVFEMTGFADILNIE